MAKKPDSKSNMTRTLGPVQDLERHLPSDWWRTLFNAVYLKTDGDVVEDADNTARDIDLLIEATGIDPESRILDLCCGQGRHCLELARRGFKHVSGVDRSRYLVRLARRRASEQNLPVTFREGDARRFRIPPDRYDCVAVMGNSFGYFELERDDLTVLDRALKAIVPGGVLALDLVDGEWLAEHFEKRSWEWIDQDQFVCRERTLSRDRQRLVCREVVVHAERGVIADQFYAERLFSFESISKILTEAGFEQVRNHGVVLSQSERNQDLGMMGRRIFLTARTPRRTAPAPEKSRKPIPAVVLLGDPSLPDPVKRGGRFNEEDLDTVRRLKEALSSLKRYSFEYLDNHATMQDRLTALAPSLVFNLCDEGWGNDALKELHVPAMLEMMGIPYTGGGPGCLAMCYDKAMVRAVAHALEIPVPLETFFGHEDHSATLPSVFPSLLKPNLGDSSIGITKQAVVNTPEELLASLQRLRTELPGRAVLVQEFLMGAEYSVALIGNPGIGMHALPILEVDYSHLPSDLPPILGYESKWLPDSPYWTDIKYKPADLAEEMQRQMVDHSIALFERLKCRDYARFDFRCGSDGVPKLLEVNPNPGWCWDGKMNLMAEFEELSYPEFLQMILDAAVERHGIASSIRTARAKKAKATQLAGAGASN